MKKTILLPLFVTVLIFAQIGVFFAQVRTVNIYEQPTVFERSTVMTKPGGVVIGPAMTRAFHYGGRHAARTSDGILHVSWEDADYNFPYYAKSTSPLGLEWTEPISVIEAAGIANFNRSLMTKLSIDPTNDDIYLLSGGLRITAADVWRMQLTRSTDMGETWCALLDVGSEVGFPTGEVSWGTCALGSDRVLHVTWSVNNQDMYYARADLSLADGKDNLEDLVFTKTDGTPGSAPISFVPSGVVFQGTVVLDRNNDPHIIFSGDGGSDTFGDKTPYHIYYKTAVDAWGPIPPTRLQAELEQCWGMPEMVFDKNNRGYYFMDGSNTNTVDFGTWEPPADPNSSTDFGTLNNGLGFEGAVPMISDNYANVQIVEDDQLYFPQADVDDANDVVYLVASTQSFSTTFGEGGDIVAMKIENATTYANTDPASMPWTHHRWITQDGGSPLGDMGAELIYDPSSTHLDIFWSGAGATSNLAMYLDGTAVIPKIDAKPQSLDVGKTVNNPINKNEEIVIKGTVKNSGTDPLGPVPVTVSIKDENDVEVYSKSLTTPPLLAGQISTEITFGSWVVENEKINYSVNLTSSFPGDEAAYNDVAGLGFFAYPDTNEALSFETFQDYLNLDDDDDHVGYPFPTTTPVGTYNIDDYVGGWTVYDSSETGTFDYFNSWYVSDDQVDNDIGAYIRHLSGIRNDTTFGDMPTGTPAQPQNEVLYSPSYDISGLSDGVLSIEFDMDIDGTDGDNNFPIHAWIDLTVDGGTTWQPVVRYSKTEGGPGGAIDTTLEYHSFDVSSATAGANSVQFRFWWRNLNNDGEFATWFIDNVHLISRTAVGVDKEIVIGSGGYALRQNYPNPFNPNTEIEYAVQKTGHVELTVYNIHGQRVTRLINGTVTSGTHRVRFDAKTLPSGVYFYKLKVDGYEKIKKMMLLK